MVLKTLILSCTACIAITSMYLAFSVHPLLLDDEEFHLDLTSNVIEQNENHDIAQRTLHVINCLSGRSNSFLDEWEFSLKSVLVNAPLDSKLHIHILADATASKAIEERMENHKLAQSVWRNEVIFTVNNVEALLPSWKSFLTQKLTNPSNREWMDKRVGIGSYFRLFAHRVIMKYECPDKNCAVIEKKDLEEAIYMDTDVVVMANLNNLMHATEKSKAKIKESGLPKPLWIWNRNSGFMVLDLTRFEEMWDLVARTPTIANDNAPKKGDQWLLGSLCDTYPNITSTISEEWDIHVGHGWRRSPQKLIDSGRDVGMMHFTSPKSFGGNFMDKGGTDKWCIRGGGCNGVDTGPGSDMDKVRSSWGLAEYYAKMSWDWAYYQGGRSRLRPGEDGHRLKYVSRISFPEES